jgi:hypothetical protein
LAQPTVFSPASGEVPPQGWATPHDGEDRADEARALLVVAQALCTLARTELPPRVRELLRWILQAVRALLDLAIRRLERATSPTIAPR